MRVEDRVQVRVVFRVRVEFGVRVECWVRNVSEVLCAQDILD